MLKSFAEGRIFGDVWGQDTPSVLALHGWRRTHDDFSRAFDRPEAGPAVLAPDLPGFGAAPPPPDTWGSAEYARALVPLLEDPATLAEQFVLVGHSFGGRVALHLAALAPDRVERLVLTGVPLLDRAGRRRRPPMAYRAVRVLRRLGLVGETRLDALRERYGSPDYRAAEGVMRSVFVRLVNERYEEPMAAVRCPVDLLWGSADTEAPLEVAERSVAYFDNARLAVLPDVGHLVPTEAPDALRRIVAGPAGSASGCR